MRTLEPLIAQLVEDVLRAIRTTSISELAELVGESPGERMPARAGRRGKSENDAHVRSRLPRRVRELAGAQVTPSPNDITDPDWLLAHATQAHAPASELTETIAASAPPALTQAANSVESPARPPAATARPRVPRSSEVRASAESSKRREPQAEEPSPPSAVVPIPRLAPNESVARISAAGLVVRRIRR